MTECRCGGPMRLRRVEMLARWGGKGSRVLVTDIPAWVCERCGEQVLEPEIARAVEALVRRPARPGDEQESVSVRPFTGHKGRQDMPDPPPDPALGRSDEPSVARLFPDLFRGLVRPKV